MRVEPNKTYVTYGEYVVELNNTRNASIETSPGKSEAGKTVVEYIDHRGCGWLFSEDGKPQLNGEWTKKLTIVEELPFKLPKLPEKYKWAGGYPQFRIPKIGEYYFSYTQYSNNTLVNRCDNEYETRDGWLGGRRLILEKVVVAPKDPTPDDDWVVQDKVPPRPGVDEISFKFKKSGAMGSYIPLTHRAFDNKLNGYVDERGDTLLVRCRKKDYPMRTPAKQPAPPKLPDGYEWTQNPPNVTKVESFTPVIIKNNKQSNFSYWITEPLGNMFGVAKSSVRYIVVSSLIGAVGYTAYNPSGVFKFAKSCVPKVHINIQK